MVARLALDRLHALGPTYIRSAFVYSVDEEQVAPAHGRPLGRLGPRLRPGRQAHLLPRVHGRGPAAQLVLAPERGRADHERDLRRDAEEGHALAAREGERRGEGRDGERRTRRPRRRRKEEDSSKGGRGDARRASKGGDADGKAGGGKGDASKPPKKPEPVVIDFDGFDHRIVDLPIHPAEISDLQAGSAGQVFFLREADGKTSVQRFDLKDRKTETIVPEADRYSSRTTARRSSSRLKERVVDRRLLRQEGRREGRAGRQAFGRQAQARRDRRAGRPARRVARDLRRGLARQPRLLLRPEDARARLARDEGEVRAVPPVPLVPRAT